MGLEYEGLNFRVEGFGIWIDQDCVGHYGSPQPCTAIYISVKKSKKFSSSVTLAAVLLLDWHVVAV